MKKLFIFALVALALGFSGVLPRQPAELADLAPAQILLIRLENGLIETTCDTGARGLGRTLDESLDDMVETGDGAVFLDTAEAVLFHATARPVLNEAAQSARLRPAANIYLVEGDLPAAEDALSYLQTHTGSVTLSRVRASLLGAGETHIPSLQNKEGRLRLIEP